LLAEKKKKKDDTFPDEPAASTQYEEVDEYDELDYEDEVADEGKGEMYPDVMAGLTELARLCRLHVFLLRNATNQEMRTQRSGRGRNRNRL
jgi:hypothetical protein